MKKSLLDIQQEIRQLDHKVKDISASITAIHDELDELRNSDTTEIDYEQILSMSQHFPFGKHPLCQLKNRYLSGIYLKILLSVLQIDHDEEITINRLIFIQWILTQSRLDITLEDLLKDSMRIKQTTFGDFSIEVPDQYRKHLIVDSLIIANINGSANADVLTYIVNLCGILGIDKEQLRILSIIVQGILKQNVANMSKTDFVLVKYFKHYWDSELLEKKLRSWRIIAVEISDSNCYKFNWKVKQYDPVKKKDVIASYRTSSWSASEIIIKSPCTGTLFHFKNNHIYYGIIAHNADELESIKTWILNRR